VVISFISSKGLVGLDLLSVKVSRSYTDTPHLVGLLWAGDQPDSQTPIWRLSQQTDIQARGGIRTRNPSKREAADLRLRPRGLLGLALWSIILVKKSFFHILNQHHRVSVYTIISLACALLALPILSSVYVTTFYVSISGLGSSVGIATDYGLDGPGSNPGGDEIFGPSRPWGPPSLL